VAEMEECFVILFVGSEMRRIFCLIDVVKKLYFVVKEMRGMFCGERDERNVLSY